MGSKLVSLANEPQSCCGGCLVVVVGAAILIGVGLWASSAISHQHELSALKPHLTEYLATERSGESMNNTPYIVGKIVVVDLGKKNFDYLVFKLPAKLRATTPDEVGTVVQTTYTDNEFGTYTGGGIGYQTQADVKLINFATGQLISTKSFLGSEPPATKSGSGDAHGGEPTQQVVDWLKSLPVN